MPIDLPIIYTAEIDGVDTIILDSTIDATNSRPDNTVFLSNNDTLGTANLLFNMNSGAVIDSSDTANWTVFIRNRGLGSQESIVSGNITAFIDPGDVGGGVRSWSDLATNTASNIISVTDQGRVVSASTALWIRNQTLGSSEVYIDGYVESNNFRNIHISSNNTLSTAPIIVDISSTGTIILNTGPVAREAIYTAHRGGGDVNISSAGTISAFGINVDAIYAETAGGIFNIDISGGTVTGGSGTGAAIHTMAAAGGTIDIASTAVVDGSASGIAIRDGDLDKDGIDEIGGNIIVTTLGEVTGDAILGLGDDVFNLVGGTYTGDIYGDDKIATLADGNHVFNWSGGALNSSFFGGNGSDTATLSDTAQYDGDEILDGGDDASVADGFIDILTINGITATVSDGTIRNWEVVNLNNSSLSISGLVTPTVNVCGGTTTLNGSSAVTDVLGCVSNDTIEITGDTLISNVIEGAGGDDNITVSGNASVISIFGDANGQDSSAAPPGNDTITINTTGTVGLVDAGAGDAIVSVSAGTVANILGQEGNDVVNQSGGTVTGETTLGLGNDTFNLSGGTHTGDIYGDSAVPGATDGDDTFNWSGGTLNGIFYGGNGSDTATISGTAQYDGTNVLDGGDDSSVADGFIDVITLNGITATVDGTTLINWEVISLNNSTISINDTTTPRVKICGSTTIIGGSSAITDVLGCVSNDTLVISDDTVVSNVIEGAGGDDNITITGNASVTSVFGDGNGQDNSGTSPGNDTITVNTTGTVGLLNGGAGNDIIALTAGTVADVLGGDGNDAITLNGATISNNIDGGAVGDLITLTSSTVIDVLGQGDNDTITLNGATVSNNIDGGAGDDAITLTLGTVIDVLGHGDNDTITLNGATIANNIEGGIGDDIISLATGTVMSVLGQDGNDVISLDGATVSNTIEGGAGDDTISLTSGTSINVFGQEGNDTITLNGATITDAVSGGDGDDNLAWSAGNLARFMGDAGSDTLLVTAAELGTSQILDGGDDASVADGQIDTLILQGLDAVVSGANIFNWEVVTIDSGRVTTGDNFLTAPTINIINSGVLDAGEDFTLTGNLVTDSSGTFEALGGGIGSYSIVGNVINDGIITMQDGVIGDQITITGDYDGLGEYLTDINTDTNQSDLLLIEGNATGTTTISVNDVGSGVGAVTDTRPGNGILVVDVNGTASASDFLLENGEVVVGTYRYTLNHETYNNFYLQSELLPQTGGAMTVSQIFNNAIYTLPGSNLIQSLRQRDGCGHDAKTDNNDENNCKDSYVWARVIGSYRDVSPDKRLPTFDERRNYIQLGVGREFVGDDGTKLILGIYGTAGDSKVRSDNPDGEFSASIDSDFYGLGLTATRFSAKGVCTDFVMQYTDYDTDIESIRGETSVDGKNIAISIEMGRPYYLWNETETVSLIPQVQLTWSKSGFDTYVDDDEVEVRSRDGQNITARLGLMLKRSRDDAASNQTSGHFIANYYYGVDRDTSIAASGTDFRFTGDKAWFELGAGGRLQVRENAIIYGEFYVGKALESGSDTGFYGRSFGFHYSF